MKTALPDTSDLKAYAVAGAYTDCYTAVVPRRCSLEQYVTAFYTTPLFKAERFILKWAVRKPSTDDDAARLAAGSAASFAAWTVEKRSHDQLLMCDYLGRTRSWFMVAALPDADRSQTQLFFGSAVVAKKGRHDIGPTFKGLLWFHHLYSIQLLRAACRRLR